MILLSATLFTFFSCLHFTHLNDGDVAVIQSPNYPKGYLLNDNLSLYNFTVDNGYGIAFLFNRFAIGPKDCVHFCDNSDCSRKKCGDKINYDPPFYLYNTSNVQVRLAAADGDREASGFQAEVRRVDLTHQQYFNCGITIDLATHTRPFFLVSDDFGKSHRNRPIDCVVHFQAKDQHTGIKIMSSKADSDDIIKVKGKSLTGKNVTEILNSYPAEGFYFQGDVTFTAGARHSYQFFLYAVQFDIETPRSDCPFAGKSWDMTQVESVTFQSQQDGQDTYNPNQQCKWRYVNTPADRQLAISFQLNTEPGCDQLVATGLLSRKMDASVIYDSYYSYVFAFAKSKELWLDFISDSSEEYVGFNGTVHSLYCNCGQSNITLSKDNAAQFISTPAFSNNQISYCENMTCSWTVNYPRSRVLILEYLALDLYNEDTLSFQYFDSSVKSSIASLNDGYGSTTVDFESLSKPNTGMDVPAKGFNILVSAVETTLTEYSIDLCAAELVHFSSVTVPRRFDGVVYIISTASCGKEFSLYHFMTDATQRYLSLAIFDGDLETGTPVKYELFSPNAVVPRLVFKNKQITVKIVRTVDVIEYDAELFLVASTIHNQNSCGAVHSTNQMSTYTTNSNPNCVDIYYYHHPNYTRFDGIRFAFSEDSPVNIFRGASTSRGNLISGSAGELPSLVFGPLFTVQTTLTSRPFTISIESQTFGEKWEMSLAGSPRVVMTADFAGELVNLPTSQEITITNKENSVVRSITCEMLKTLQEGENVVMRTLRGSKVVKSEPFLPTNGKFKYEAEGDTLVIVYHANQTTANGGLLATCRLGDEINSADTRPVLLFSLIYLLFKIIVY